ncbi:MAG TPA: IS1 family transposase [Acidobacteriota bacterium]|nr:IS1 family transposase [Acidobacteriota bacterium]
MTHPDCPHCDSGDTRKYGRRYDGGQRYQCKTCKRTWSESKPLHPVLGRLDRTKALLAINCLLEGCSVRSAARLTGITKKSILALLNRAASRCRTVMEEKMRDLDLAQIQVDELWTFIQKKQKRLRPGDPHERGDCYTFVAIDPESKIIPTFALGKRDERTAFRFISNLADTLGRKTKPQLSSDAFRAYPEAVEAVFGADIDYGQVIKLFHAKAGNKREGYWPSGLVATTRRLVTGRPDKQFISTSIIERSNLTFRMAMRRFTRLTNGFSKNFANLRDAVSLHVAAYNFTRVHQTLGVTPAMEAGIVDSLWGVEELLGVDA